MSLTVEQLAEVIDRALDEVYKYGRSSPGNNFGWQANLESARAAKLAIDGGVLDINKIASAVHEGWNTVARADYQGELALDTPTDHERKRKRFLLTQIPYDHLPEGEKEKDRVVARAVLKAMGH